MVKAVCVVVGDAKGNVFFEQVSFEVLRFKHAVQSTQNDELHIKYV